MGARGRLLLVLAISGASVFSSAGAQNSATVEAIQGEVLLGGAPIFHDQKITPRARLTTGRDSYVVLRFDDGRRAALGENTILTPPGSSGTLPLMSGAVRVRATRGEAWLQTSHAQIRAQGPVDYTVVVSDATYIDVREGRVLAANAGGETTFTAGNSGSTSSFASRPAPGPTGAAAGAVGALAALDLEIRQKEEEAAKPPRGLDALTALPPREQKFWIGGSALVTRYDDGATAGLLTEGTVERRSTGWRVYGGWQFSRHWAMEVGYADLGAAEYSGTFESMTITNGTLEVKGFDAAVLGSIALGRPVTLFGKVGAFVWEAKTSDLADGVPSTASSDGTGFVVGTGLVWAFQPSLALRTELEARRAADDAVLSLSLGLEYRF